MNDQARLIWGREPAGFISLVRLAMYAGVAWGLKISDTQMVATFAFVEAALWWWTRSQVVSPVTHAREVKEALYSEIPQEPDLVPQAIAQGAEGLEETKDEEVV